MTDRSLLHSSYSVERTYAPSPPIVFAAWAEPSAKRQWFADTDDWVLEDYALDFRVGGKEHARGRLVGGPLVQYDASYFDVVANERIVYAYEMRIDSALVSVSLGTIEVHPDGSGTRLVYTEQGAFLDGLDDPHAREIGTGGVFDHLEAYLQQAARG
jgi:uncharacterized protein YndB with AHSA1/START domain